MDIETLIKGKESENIEFKESLKEKDDILKTICAFSNGKGGVIMIGVSDKGEPVGVDLGKRTVELLANEIKGSLEPPILPQMEIAKIDSRYLVVIRVLEGINKPYLYKGVAYRRVGSSTQRIPREELERIVIDKYRDKLSFEDRPVDAENSDIDEGEVKKFVAISRERRGIDITYKGKVDFLRRMGLLKSGEPTNAAILLFGKDPQSLFPYCIVKCGRFRDGDLIDEKEINGTITKQLENSLLFLMNNIRTTHTVNESGRREEKWEIPIEVLREVVVNALVHRDYLAPSPVYIKVWDDRIEVVNPGGLLPPLTPEKLKGNHPSVLRNPKIASALFNTGFIERWGYGTNKVVRLCLENGLEEPEFIEEDGFFKVILYRKHMNKYEAKVIEYLKKRSATSAEIAKDLGVNERTARKYLSSLVLKGVAKREKMGRSVRYHLN